MENSKKFMVKEVKLVYKGAKDLPKRPKITCSQDAYNVLVQCWDIDTLELKEQAKVLLLNNRSAVLAIYNLSDGGTTATVVDPRLILVTALKINANKIILAHNHPSGSLLPSETDKLITLKVTQAAQLLDIHVLDHLIITANGYTSFADQGLISLTPDPH